MAVIGPVGWSGLRPITCNQNLHETTRQDPRGAALTSASPSSSGRSRAEAAPRRTLMTDLPWCRGLTRIRVIEGSGGAVPHLCSALPDMAMPLPVPPAASLAALSRRPQRHPAYRAKAGGMRQYAPVQSIRSIGATISREARKSVTASRQPSQE